MAQKFEVNEGKFGKFITSTTSLSEGQVICKFSGEPISFEDSLNLGDKESYALQIDQKYYILLQDPDCYFNHSCEPNCGLNPALELVALRDIEDGEELNYDYSTTMLERHWTMDCSCNNKGCRKTISDFDRIPAERQQFYLARNVVQDFIIKFLKPVAEK
jgi:hypothetical protein